MTRNKQWDSILIKIEECKNDIQYILDSTSNIPMIEIDIALEKLSRIYERLLSLKLGAATTEENGFFAKNSSLIAKIIKDSVFNTDLEKKETTQEKSEKVPEVKNEIKAKTDLPIIEEPIKEEQEQPKVIEEKKEPTNKEEIKTKTDDRQNKSTKTIAETLKKDTKSTIGELMASVYKKKDIATLQQLKPIKDLKQAISINDKIMFIREIFANNVDKYNETLTEVNNCSNLDEALALLDSKLTIQSENTAMQQLLELIYRRFM
ncbi:MAG: hypothetical protein Fur0028_05060 [Bacteroidales bacterium]